jgi:hypothetical protein
MNTRNEADKAVRAVPLLTAVFCAGCETISNSPHDVCAVCGSHSLTSLWRLMGGKLPSEEGLVERARYNLDVTAKVHEIPATELEQLLRLLTRLAEAGGDVECLHINLESVLEREALAKAA